MKVMPARLFRESPGAPEVDFGQFSCETSFGRTRHLSCRTLWIQDHVKRKLLETASIPTKENYADLGTKKLSQDRMHYLTHTIGVFDVDAKELVGPEVVQR